MVSKGKDISASHIYAQAVLDLACARGIERAIATDLASIRQIVHDNHTFAVFLKDPSVSEQDRRKVIDAAFAGRLDVLLLSTLLVMNHKNRLGILVGVADAYQEMLDRKLGNIKVDVTVARELDPAMLEEVRQSISNAIKKNALIHQKVDERIIGGLVIQVEDKLIDGSVKKQLELMKRRLMAAAP
ncbi:MAG: ATP synthase F1 subunit delta [Tepidisphaeraceae bacterium]|jgi:F-type H+-transporting ATPase subunit delta